MSQEDELDRNLDPSEFMRSRRPELFPDSVSSDDEPPIETERFEFQLDQLTAHKSETQFEHFCRRLCEKEVCPNLTTQTGPTGGGDRKTDSETYPVDSEIALRWYHGEQQAATDRWAFAFSAKRDWRTKVRADVDGIVGTNRGYTRIYFLTNQPARDRAAAEVEDGLRDEHGIDVRILDRTWIVEKVVENRRWDIVYATLGIDRPSMPSQQVKGPLDTQREAELAELDNMIENQERYRESKYQLVVDCLESALIARGLGRPRTEIDGRFARAERLARTYHDNSSLARVLYGRAWTAFWWYSDLDEFDRLYDEVAALLLTTDVVWSLEKLVTLWQVGISSSRRDPARLDRWFDRKGPVVSALEQFACDDTKPTAALWAQTELCLLRLTQAGIDGTPLGPVLTDLATVARQAYGHLDYPLDTLASMVEELGDALGEAPEYDDLFETLMEMQASRVSQSQQGSSRLLRGRQKLDAGDYYGSITQYSRAVTLLAHEEDKQQFVMAIVGASAGYQEAGLLWAARAYLAFALDRLVYEINVSGQIPPMAVPCLLQLARTELRVGRVTCAVLWMEILNVLEPVVKIRDRDYFERSKLELEMTASLLILRTLPEDWTRLGQVPKLLGEVGLDMARATSLFALGHEDLYREEYDIPTDEDLDKLYSLLVHQPGATAFPAHPDWLLDERASMETTILGCHVRLDAANRPRTIAWGEAILAYIEAFFSTAMTVDGLMSMRPSLRITLDESAEEADAPFVAELQEDECGESNAVILHASESLAAISRLKGLDEALIDLLAKLASALHLSGDLGWLKEFFTEERAQDRASFALQSIQAVGDLLGEEPKYRVDSQLRDPALDGIEYVRLEPWTPGDYYPDFDVHEQESAVQGPPTFEKRAFRHDELELRSVINVPAWDEAGWKGVFFATAEDHSSPPFLGLVFSDPNAATKIFKGWHRDLGAMDAEEQLSLTLITGIDLERPADYRLAISSRLDPEALQASGSAFFTAVMRYQEMKPEDPANLDRFLMSYASAGEYLLGPAMITSSGPSAGWDLAISKRAIRVVPAWQVGRHDPAITALHGITRPILPEGVDEIPFLAAMDFLNRDDAIEGEG